MHFNIYVSDQVGAKLTHLAEHSGKTRNALIREAIEEWLKLQAKSEWPKEVLAFKGIQDFPPFEQSREKLKSPKKDPFA